MAASGIKTVITALWILILSSQARAGDPMVSRWNRGRDGPKPRVTSASQADAVPGAKLGQPSLTLSPGPVHLAVGAGASKPSQAMGFQLNLAPPEPRELFRFDTEERVRQRFRLYLQGFPAVEFPPTDEAAPLSQTSPRLWAQLVATAEPAYVCYKRLWFEQRNSERYGWDFGVLQPFVSTGVFYTDLALLPLHWMTNPGRWFDCSAGQCLPGDPVPLLWNPVFSK